MLKNKSTACKHCGGSQELDEQPCGECNGVGEVPVNPELYNQMIQFVREVKEALTDKSKFGTKLNVNETGWLIGANEILNKIK